MHFPAHFELVGEQEERLQESDDGMEQQLQQQQQPVARSIEAYVGQKLQLIGDQFHREHLQLVSRNQHKAQIRLARAAAFRWIERILGNAGRDSRSLPSLLFQGAFE